MVGPALRARFLRDPLPVRLGGLAADLARIASSAENPQNRDMVAGLFHEGKFFAEWAAPEAPLSVQDMLREVQLWLALEQRRWVAGQPPINLQQEAQQWSDRLLDIAGLR